MTDQLEEVLDLPYTETPHTLVGVFPVGHVYYHEFPGEPTPEEYARAGVRLTQKMLSTIGQRPSQWFYLPTAQVDLAKISDNLRTPIRVQ